MTRNVRGRSESVDGWRKISFKKKVVKQITWCEITPLKVSLVRSRYIFLGNMKCKRCIRLTSNNCATKLIFAPYARF